MSFFSISVMKKQFQILSFGNVICAVEQSPVRLLNDAVMNILEAVFRCPFFTLALARMSWSPGCGSSTQDRSENVNAVDSFLWSSGQDVNGSDM